MVNPPTRPMLRLVVRARTGDRHGSRSMVDSLLDLLKARGVAGATVVQGVKGFGARGTAKLEVLALSVSLPVVVEAVGEPAVIEGLLAEVKDMVGHNGLVTVERVEAL